MTQPSVTVWTMSWNSQERRWDFDYFLTLDVLSGPQCEAVMRGWGLAPFWYNETMLVLCPSAGVTAAAQRSVEHQWGRPYVCDL